MILSDVVTRMLLNRSTWSSHGNNVGHVSGHVARGQTLILGHEPVLIAGTSAPRKLETVRLAWEKIPSQNIFLTWSWVRHLETYRRSGCQLLMDRSTEAILPDTRVKNQVMLHLQVLHPVLQLLDVPDLHYIILIHLPKYQSQREEQ